MERITPDNNRSKAGQSLIYFNYLIHWISSQFSLSNNQKMSLGETIKHQTYDKSCSVTVLYAMLCYIDIIDILLYQQWIFSIHYVKPESDITLLKIVIWQYTPENEQECPKFHLYTLFIKIQCIMFIVLNSVCLLCPLTGMKPSIMPAFSVWLSVVARMLCCCEWGTH